MIVQAEKFTQHDPDILGTLWNLDTGQHFHCRQIGEIVGGAVHIIYPVGIGDKLMPGLSLTDFFHSPVMISDIHIHIRDRFAIERHDKPHQPMRAGVVRPHVENQFGVPGFFPQMNPRIQGLMKPGVSQGIGRHLCGAPRIGFEQRMPFPVHGHDQSLKIGMPLETDTEHIVSFTLVPVGAGPQIRKRRGFRLRAIKRRLDANPAWSIHVQQMTDYRHVRIEMSFKTGGFIHSRNVFQTGIARSGFCF